MTDKEEAIYIQEKIKQDLEKIKDALIVKNESSIESWKRDKKLLLSALVFLDKAICKVPTPCFETEVAGKMLVETIQQLKTYLNDCHEQLG